MISNWNKNNPTYFDSKLVSTKLLFLYLFSLSNWSMYISIGNLFRIPYTTKNFSFEKFLYNGIHLESNSGVLGLEPRNDGFKVRCLTSLAIPQYLCYFSCSSKRHTNENRWIFKIWYNEILYIKKHETFFDKKLLLTIL